MRPQKQIAVFGSFLTNDQSAEVKIAEELGWLLAQNGLKVVCGGHGGIANPLVAGVLKGGGRVVGLSLVETKFPGRSFRSNPLIDELVHVNSLSERLEFFANSDAFIFFTGGIGTLSEFAFMWHALQLEGDFNRPLVLISGSWRRVLAQIRNEQMVKHKYYRLIHLCEQAKDAVAVVANDYSIKYDEPENIFYKETVLFGLDGTLVESPEEDFLKACENLGYFLPIQELRESFDKAGKFPTTSADARPLFAEVLEYLGINGKSAVEIADHAAKEVGRVPRLYGEGVEVLRHFKENGFSTGVVSGRPAPQVEEILTAHNLSGWIDLVCPSHRGNGMSDGELLGQRLNSLGLKKDEIVYVGDHFREDCLAPRAAGIDGILLDRYLTRLADTSAVVIRSLVELKHLVKHRRMKG